MTQKQSILKKTAVATLVVSMLAGSATGVMASAQSKHGKSDKGNSGYSSHDNKKKNNKVQFNLNFHDLNEKQMKWAYDHIIRLAAQGVFNGYQDGSFKPYNNITRIEALVAAVRLLGLKEEAEKPENMNAKLNFKDFDKLKKKYGWAVGYVTVALENDLFAENDTTINPDQPANRLWASVLLVKALKLDAEAKKKMDTELPFRDANQIPAGSVGYIAVALEKNLITGYSDKTFQPNRPVTRAELAALLDRVDQQLPVDHAQAITGTIQSVINGNLTVKKADNTTVSVPLDGNVFIFRKEVKSPVSALQVGDEVLVRTFQGKAVFIEVTKPAQVSIQFTDIGKVSAFTFNTEGKLATITITKDVNGTAQTTSYNVDSSVVITGVVAPNAIAIVKGDSNVVKSIEIQS